MTTVSQVGPRSATISIALIAIGQHIADNALLAPHTITLPDHYSDKVVLFLHDFGVQRWVESIQVDDEKNEKVKAGHFRSTIKGRISCPVGDVTIYLRFIREAPLQVVTS